MRACCTCQIAPPPPLDAYTLQGTIPQQSNVMSCDGDGNAPATRLPLPAGRTEGARNAWAAKGRSRSTASCRAAMVLALLVCAGCCLLAGGV